MIEIPARIYSQAIWETIRYRTKELGDFFRINTKDKFPATVSEHTANMLYRVAFYYQPQVVIEIGTYIGRSAIAMAEGMDTGAIYTCDADANLFKTQVWQGIDIKCHNTRSTAMLERLQDKADLFFFDGRIQPADVEHIVRLSKPETVYLFDDFEGVEKGVCNALMLQHLGMILVLPEPGQTLAMMIRKVGFARQ